ncbi:DUF1015 family protein [Actinokineospora terrae]|uniref:Uncharacterized conserved protein, DUF1015 family n=1 Tax=Actinokineospora terrae TaxID=155974 RepID=A0A1H9L2N8_9PSEU|nr:DUF1015 family protein [Actinokineospora terrae]SER05427.1 Uncharacterized conserved protein, DUF1015 family [Actinokineospora terrae]
MTEWVRPIRRGWLVRGEVPGPDVDEFADADRVVAALARPGTRGSLLAVQHPHRTPTALAAGHDLLDVLAEARRTLRELTRTAYRPVADVIAPYRVDGPDGSATGVLCLVDPAAVGADGVSWVRHSEQVYPEVVAERAAVLTGLGCATSAALLIPVVDGQVLTDTVDQAIAAAGAPAISTVDSGGRRHRVWLLGPGPIQDAVLSVVAARPLMVADGNHRVAAAAAADLGGLLALVTAGPGLRIGGYHRVLTGTGLDADALSAAWRAIGLQVTEVAAAAPPEHPGSVVVETHGRTLCVDLPPSTALDHAQVETLLLRQALHLDPEGTHVRPLPEGRAPDTEVDAVLRLAPVPLAQVLAVHAAGGRMPRKSTYFTPKPRSGLLLADLDR